MAALEGPAAARLKAEIAQEREHLARTCAEVEQAGGNADAISMYALALLLMNYYTGVERIFQRIATALGGLPPSGERWHRQLLQDMLLDIPGVRPRVVCDASMDVLDRLLRFRHLVRNLYVWSLDRSDIDAVASKLPALHRQLAADLDAFSAFLDDLAR